MRDPLDAVAFVPRCDSWTCAGCRANLIDAHFRRLSDRLRDSRWPPHVGRVDHSQWTKTRKAYWRAGASWAKVDVGDDAWVVLTAAVGVVRRVGVEEAVELLAAALAAIPRRESPRKGVQPVTQSDDWGPGERKRREAGLVCVGPIDGIGGDVKPTALVGRATALGVRARITDAGTDDWGVAMRLPDGSSPSQRAALLRAIRCP